MREGAKRTQKHEEARNSLPPDLFEPFDNLVQQYQFFATKHHRAPFVSYVVLADLIRSGWRPSAQALAE